MPLGGWLNSSRLFDRDAVDARPVRRAQASHANFHAALHETPVGCVDAGDGNAWVKNEFGLASLELDLDFVATTDNRCAGDRCVGHRLVAAIVHWPLSIAYAAHGVREDAQFRRMKLMVSAEHGRRGDEIVRLDVGERGGLALENE